MSTESTPGATPRRTGRWRGVAGGTVLLVAVLGIAAVAGARARPAAEAYAPAMRLDAGPELVFIFVGGSFCLAHRREGFPEAVEQAKLALSRRAAAGNRQFRAVGVAMDWDTDEGLRFLRRFGRFDEVSLGGNWVNGALLRYVWRDLPGRPAVPQVVVAERRIVKDDRAIDVVEERVVRRVFGADEIADWARAGAPLRGAFPRTTRSGPAVPGALPERGGS